MAANVTLADVLACTEWMLRAITGRERNVDNGKSGCREGAARQAIILELASGRLARQDASDGFALVLGNLFADLGTGRFSRLRLSQPIREFGFRFVVSRHRQESLFRGFSVLGLRHATETCCLFTKKLRVHRQTFQAVGSHYGNRRRDQTWGWYWDQADVRTRGDVHKAWIGWQMLRLPAAPP